MNTRLKNFTIFSLIGLVLSLSAAANAQIRAYRVTDRQVQTLLDRIETRSNTFRNTIDRSLDRSAIDGTNREDSINDMIANYETAADSLRNNFSSRRSTSADVEEVLNRAVLVNAFMRNNRVTPLAQSQWNLLRTDLNTLAGYYRVSSNWNEPVISPVGQNVYSVSDTQLRTLLTRIETRTNLFQQQVDRSLGRSVIDGTDREDSINTMIARFETATDTLRENFTARRSTAANVQEVLNRAVGVNTFMRSNRLTRPAQNSWNLIRTDLDTLAGYYRVASNWNAVPSYPVGQNVYYVPDTQVRTLLTRVETRTDTFKSQISRNLNRSNIDGSAREDSINAMVANFEMATDRLRNNFSSGRSTVADVQEVLNRAVGVDTFVRNNRLSRPAETSWTQIRGDLDTLAGYYRVASNWNATDLPGTPLGGFDSRITGTYRLNTGQSDNVSTVVDRALINANVNQRDRMRQNLERRLASPLVLTLEKRGQQVTLSSSNAQQVIFDADGTSRTETSPNGRTVRTSVTANNTDLTINYEGDRINDYYVSFTPMNNGQLKVTRRVYLENQNETVTVTSVYDKTSQTATWNTTDYPVNTGNVGGFIIPNNTSIVATLDTPLSTRVSQNGDRFSMTVTSPSQYRGAVIEGRVVGERSGVVSGRANMSLTFDTIRMRDGRTYSFAGIVDQVRQADGDLVSVNNEGAVRDSSQTTKTVTRAGIGALLGAIIGAVAGGGSGAAIGAGVGAGAGAGTVILQGRDNLELATGSQFTITSTAPGNVGVR